MENSSQKASVVLIADHDDARRRLLREAFEAGDLTVIEAPDSESCLLTCKHLRPDLLVLSGDFVDALAISRAIKADAELQSIRILVQFIGSEDDSDRHFLREWR